MSDPQQSQYPVERPWLSLVTVLVVQTQNALNDNFLKFVLISLGQIVAKGQWVGDNAQRILPAFIPLAFLLFSPLAGYLSDRYSKRDVLFWCIIVQLVILGLTIFALETRNFGLSIWCLFFLSIQSTFFSPSKQGILKELVGSKKLTIANGMLQMLTNLAVLVGMVWGGWWFGERLASGEGAWNSALVPVVAISLAALVPLSMKFLVDKTPSQTDASFEMPILWRHFGYMKELFRGKAMTRASVGVAYYWFVAAFYGVIIFDISVYLYPDPELGRAAIDSVFFPVKNAAQEASKIAMILGVGLMIGSVLVASISRDGILLKLVPAGGIGLCLAIFGTGLFAPGSLAFYISLVFLGLFGGFYLVPLSSFLQDISPNEKRGRIMAAAAVLVSIVGVGSIVVSQIFTLLNIPLGFQMMFFVIPTALMTWYVSALIGVQKKLNTSN